MTSARETPAQGGPPPISQLRGFPVRRLREGRRLFRAHRQDSEPWWFGSDAFGRFDLHPPRGTCYLGESALVAVREKLGVVLGGAGEVPGALLDDIVVSALALPHELEVANVRSALAARFGVLRELEVMVPYAVPQAWAQALADAGHDGIAYGARFTPGRAGGIACFGNAGVRPWPVDPRPVRAIDVSGAPVRVGRPRLAQLTVIQPPRT